MTIPHMPSTLAHLEQRSISRRESATVSSFDDHGYVMKFEWTSLGGRDVKCMSVSRQ